MKYPELNVTIQSPVKSSKFQVLSSKLFVTFGTNYIAYGQISLRTWNLELKTLSDPSGKGTTTEQIRFKFFFSYIEL